MLQTGLNRRILAALLIVGGGTAIAKGVAAVKDLAVAAQFGTGDALDAFLIAFLLPSFAVNTIAGSLTPAFVPAYIELRDRRGREAADRLLAAVLWRTVGILTIVMIGLAVVAPLLLPLLGSGFSPDKARLARSLFYFLLPMIVISGLSTIWAAVLNAGERFALVALAPALQPLGLLGAIALAGRTWGPHALVAGVIAGLVAEAVAVGWGLRRLGTAALFRYRSGDVDARLVTRQHAPLVLGAMLMGSTTLVDQSMAATLGSGSVSVLSYGSKLPGVVSAIGAMALGTAVLPHFSRLLAAGEVGLLLGLLRQWTVWVTAGSSLGALVLIALSRPIIALWFQRGEFTGADAVAVAGVQSLLMLQLPFFMLGMLYVRLLSALKANEVLLYGTCVSVVVNVVLNYALMRYLGVAGIALSTSLVYVVAFLYLRIMCRRRLRELSNMTVVDSHTIDPRGR